MGLLQDSDGSCKILACSESQGTSVGDFSTNYCDIRNLYCGSADGCTAVEHDFASSEVSHSGSIGAGHDFSGCIVKQQSLVTVKLLVVMLRALCRFLYMLLTLREGITIFDLFLFSLIDVQST